MKRMSCKFKLRGLTLIELMIALVILAVTLTAAAPAMQQMIHGSRLRAETSRLLDALNLARSEAILRNTPVSLCPSAMALSGEATCAGHYSDGWIVFTNQNSDEVVDVGADEVVATFAAAPAGYSLTNSRGTQEVDGVITYLPDGSSRRNLTVRVCPAGAHALKPWSVVLNNVGRARVQEEEEACSAGSI